MIGNSGGAIFQSLENAVRDFSVRAGRRRRSAGWGGAGLRGWTGIFFCAAFFAARAADIPAPVDPLAAALGGLAATNAASARCMAAAYFRAAPRAAASNVIVSLVEMLADVRRVELSGKGFVEGLPSSPASEAGRTLEAAGGRAVESLLSALASTNADVRKRVVDSLGRIGDARATAPLVAQLGDADRAVALAASDAVLRFGTNAVAPLRDYLAAAAPANADCAVWALGQLHDAESLPLLMNYVSNEDERTRLAAGAALSNLGEAGAKRLLEQWHNAGESERRRIIPALDKIRTPPVEDQLILVALGDRSAPLRAEALRGVPVWDDDLAPLVLMCAQRDGESGIRDDVQKAFKLLGPKAAECLVGYLGDDNPVVWQPASVALAGMGAAAAPPLFTLLRDPKVPREVKRRIAWVLLRMSEVKISCEDSERLWIAAEDWQLLSIFTEGIPPPLVEAANSDFAAYRIGALTTMAAQKLRGAESYLFKALDDPDPDVVRTAVRGLADYGYTYAPQLENTVQHAGTRASRAAAEALAQIGYRPRTQAMSVEFFSSRDQVDRLVEIGGLVPTHLERRLEHTTDPAETARLALDLSRLLPLIQPDERFAVDNVMVRAAFVGTNRAARLEAIREMAGRPNLLLVLALDNEPQVSGAARQLLASLAGNTAGILAECFRSGDARLTDTAFLVLQEIPDKQIGAFDWLLRQQDAELSRRAAKLFAERHHAPADEADQIAMAVENRDWRAALGHGERAIPAVRKFIVTAPRDALPALFDALAGSDSQPLVNLLADIPLVLDRRNAELAWPAIQRAGARLRAQLLLKLHEGRSTVAAGAASLLERLDLAPKPGESEYLFFLAASGRVGELDEHRDEAAKLFLRELHRPDPDRRLRGAIWLTLLQREPDRPTPFSMANLVSDYIDRLDHGDPVAKAQAAALLSQLGTNAAPAVPALIRTLADNTRIIPHGAKESYFLMHSPAAAAAMALGSIGTAAVGPLLDVWSTAETEDDVRTAAAAGLARLRDARCGAAQLKILETDKRVNVRNDAMASLVATDPVGAVRPLLRISSRYSDPAMSGAVQRSLRAAGSNINAQLILALYDEDSSVQEIALTLLTERSEPAAFEAASHLAHSGFEDVRNQAARYFGSLAEMRCIGPLVELLNDRSIFVEWNAAEAIRRIGRPAVPKLIEALPAAPADVQTRIALLLRSITGENFGADAAAWQAWLKKNNG